MRLFTSVVSAVFFLIMTEVLWADEGTNTIPQIGFYLSFSPSAVVPFSVGTTSPSLSPGQIKTQWGSGISAGLGYRYGDFKIEGEFMTGRSDADHVSFSGGGGDLSGYFEMWGATVNLVYDIPTGTKLRPYLGTGLGSMHIKAHDITLSDFPPTRGSNTLFTYKLMAGVSYALTDTYNLLLGYRFMGIGEQDYETGGVPLHGDSIPLHAIQMGVNLYF